MADIMAVGAHPDDIEFGCGGILAKMKGRGSSIVMIDLTLGDKGSRGTPEIRKQEALQAAELIGAEREFLDFSDCEIIDSYAGRLQIAAAIRRHKPRIVLAPMWHGTQNHPDHIAVGTMTRYACRYSRFSSIMPELSPHRPQAVLHYLQRNFDTPDFIIDISDYTELWKKMIVAHQSQLQTCPYLEWNLQTAARLGMLIGAPFAQGLCSGNPIVIDGLEAIDRGTDEI